ncbi:MAG: SPOR domain-containing protein [Rickettsiaceae bacterium]|nr:SPOR domain-containing protein [Rickettsiaceae bacterium]
MKNTKKIFVIWLIFIGTFLMLYHFLSQKEVQIITIEAQIGPTKIRPEEPGGIVIPNTDSLIYNQESFNKKTIKLLPSPENPIEIKRVKLAAPSEGIIYNDSIDDILNNLEYYEKLYSELADQSDQSEQDEDNNIITPTNLVAEKHNLDNLDNVKKSIKLSGSDLEIEQAVSKRRQFTNVNKNNPGKSGYLIQLGVAFNENDAQNKWQLIKKKHYKLLSDNEMILQKRQGTNGKFFYLIMSGYYGSFKDAKYICRQLIAQKQSCIITK